MFLHASIASPQKASRAAPRPGNYYPGFVKLNFGGRTRSGAFDAVCNWTFEARSSAEWLTNGVLASRAASAGVGSAAEPRLKDRNLATSSCSSVVGDENSSEMFVGS
jgi:hypothetical protein